MKNSKMFFIVIVTFIVIITTFIIVSTPDKKIAVEESPECVRGGCSGQMCIEKNVESGISTCEWREVYKCYKMATCERQTDGKCGFTTNEQFGKCLEENN